MRSFVVLIVLLYTPTCIFGGLLWNARDPVKESSEVKEDVSLDRYSSAPETQLDKDSTIAEHTARIGDLEDAVRSLRSIAQMLQIRNESAMEVSRCHEMVAFHAVNDLAEYAHLGIGQHILFNTVLLNIRNGFHVNHGIFIAPTGGLYIFSASILSSNGASTSLFAAEIVKDGIILARLYGHGVNGFHAQGSATVTTQLKVGDHVWVQLKCCPNDSLFGIRYSTFSGALIA